MTMDNLINLIAAILVGGGTFFLGFMAWRTIRQTRSIQKTKKRERLLNEIIEWAIDVAECTYKKETIIKHDEFIVEHMNSLVYSLCTIQTRNPYISIIASSKESAFGYELVKSVEALEKNLEEHINLIMRWRNIITEEPEFADECESKASKHKGQLYESVIKVIKEAAKIKTRDIGKKEENMSKEGEATGSSEIALKDIEDQLKRQDKKMELATWGIFAAQFGLAIFVFAFANITEDFGSTRIFLLVVGGFMMISSIILMVKSRLVKSRAKGK